MTYIVGAKCTDGVVFVGDTKITLSDGSGHSYADKIFSPLNHVVVGSSGATGLYRTFQSRLILAVQQTEKEKTDINWHDEFILLTERVIHEMVDEYGPEMTSNNFDALLAFRFSNEPYLFNYNGFGLPQPVTNHKAIGHGEPYGSILLKTLWKNHKPMTMDKFASIGCLIIKYIQDFDLDNSVGIDPDGDYLPQVWFLPTIPEEAIQHARNDNEIEAVYNSYPIQQLSKLEVKAILDEIQQNITLIHGALESIRI